MILHFRAVFTIAYNEISQVLKRRYSLQNNAIEIFCDSGNSYFVVFGQYQRNKVYHNRNGKRHNIRNLNTVVSVKCNYPLLYEKSLFASGVLKRNVSGVSQPIFKLQFLHVFLCKCAQY